MLAPLTLALVVGGSWSRGRYGTLSVDLDARPISYSYSYSYATAGGNDVEVTFPSTVGSLVNASVGTAGSGIDPVFGGYDDVTFDFGSSVGSLVVRYLTRMDAFVFARMPTPSGDAADLKMPHTWPAFQTGQIKPNTTRCIGWQETYMFPGSYMNDGIEHCRSGGPILFFEPPSHDDDLPSATMALSPLDHFGVNLAGVYADKSGAREGLGVAVRGALSNVPTSAVLLARPAFGRATKALGSVLRQHHAATKKRGSIAAQLSVWNDNQASRKQCFPCGAIPRQKSANVYLGVSALPCSPRTDVRLIPKVGLCTGAGEPPSTY